MSSSFESVEPRDTMFDFNLASEEITTSPFTVTSWPKVTFPLLAIVIASVSLGSTLSKLLQIDGKSYEMKGKQKMGVLAQEIKEVFPELVSKDDNEMLAVNYQGLVPVLINALKDQQNEIDELKEMVQSLISRK